MQCAKSRCIFYFSKEFIIFYFKEQESHDYHPQKQPR